jgi:hypothetical protein
MALDDVLAVVTLDFLEGLRRTEEVGADDFSKAVDAYRFVRDIAAAASVTDPHYFDANTHGHVENLLIEIRDTSAPEIMAFRWADDGAAAAHARITARAEEMATWMRTNVLPFIRQVEVDSAKAAADVKELEKARRDADEILSNLRVAAGERGATQLSSFYSGEVERYQKQGYVFAVLAGVAATVLVLLGLVFFFGPWAVEDSGDQEWQDIAHDLAVRIFFLGIGVWALAFLARIYRVARHLEVVNAQKQAALDTFPLFLAALSTDQQRDIVTAELARSVLQPADSGFITADRERTVVESSPVSLLTSRGSAIPPS